MKKKIICISIIIVICAGLFAVCKLEKSSSDADAILLENSYSREAYLNIKGWDVKEVSCETVKVPESFEGIYKEYADVQKKQDLPLDNYKGKEVQRFLYNVSNYGSENKVCAELLISENRLIAAAIIENAPNGFISPLS